MKALYSYTAQGSDEMSFQEGDTIYVKTVRDDGWVEARHENGALGLAPGNYLNMES